MFREANVTAETTEDYRKQTPCQQNSMRAFVQMNSSSCHESPEINASDLDGLCVLIVDDSWDVATGVKMLLESWGADILGPVATIAEAELMVSKRSPNVAIVDMTLRGEQSHSLIDRLCDKGIRVVVITGDADVSLPLGRAAVILQKPLKEDSLFASLRPGSPPSR